MELKWFGTATINIIHEDQSIIFDPFRSLNPKLQCVTAQELAGMGDIFLTHGHFDHAMDVPLVTSLGTSKVFCSPETGKLLIAKGAARERVNIVQPGDIIENSLFMIKVLSGQHCQADGALILRTCMSPRTLRNIQTCYSLLKTHFKFDMGKILVYQIEAGGKTILHMGSLNLAAEEVYPEGVDLLTLPFQGRSDINSYGLQFIERIKPKTIFLHHYDDSFPPLTSQIDCWPFAKSVQTAFPGLKVIIPEYITPYLV